MGFFSKITKPFKNAVNKIAGRGNDGQSAPEAPELELTNPEGEAEKKEEAKKVLLRKGKKGLRIKKAGNADVSAGAGRNLV